MAGRSHVDIQTLVEDWATNTFFSKANRKEKKLLSNDFIDKQIDWKRVRFVHGEPEYDPHPPKPGKGRPTNNVLFCTTFTNKTNEDQTYSFKTERTTRSSATVSTEQGYTKGMEAGLTLKLPGEILEANLGFSREITLTTTEEETVEEELSWGVDSQIMVKGRHRAEAQLIIVEEKYKGKFVVKTTITGRVRVAFYNLKDNNSFIKCIEGNIEEIVRRAIERKQVSTDIMHIDGATRSVVVKTQGDCLFKYGLKQNVEVDQLPID